MSFDFQLGHACPHLTIEEEVPLGADRRELKTIQPVASATHIRITANNSVQVRKEGTFSPAQLFGSLSGPFNIVQNENTVSIRNRAQLLEDIVLPVGSRVEAARVVDVLSAALRNAGVEVVVGNSNGFLVLVDALDRGPRSRVRIEGDAAESLGFIHQIQARGSQAYPAWGFVEQDNISILRGLTGVQQVTTRFPKFDSMVKGNPIFKVTYTTYQEYCRRCQSFGIENDYRIAANGEPLTIQNEDLLNQGVLKILETSKGSNPFHPSYGTTLLDRIGIKAIGAGITTINEDVNTALLVYQRTQELQGRFQLVTAREKLANILSVTTLPSDLDPTVFEVEIIASNAANVPVTITTVFAAPGVGALAGSNGLSLGLAGFGLDPRTGTIQGIAPR
jgi:phage baseplate assembly protein W